MERYYKILNLTADASFEQVQQSYQQLKKNLRELSLVSGEDGNKAAKDLMALEDAFSHIVEFERASKIFEEFGTAFGDVRENILKSHYDEAQALLDAMSERSAEWHYWQSIIFYKRQWYLESKKQLKLAMNLDPKNEKYQNSYARLRMEMEGHEQYLRDLEARAESNELRGCFLTDCMALCCASCCL